MCMGGKGGRERQKCVGEGERRESVQESVRKRGTGREGRRMREVRVVLVREEEEREGRREREVRVCVYVHLHVHVCAGTFTVGGAASI